MSGTLYVVATPIGNLEDVTLRALRILREVVLIAAEDTRRTARLLQHYSISTRTTSLHEHNEREKTPKLIERLRAGDAIALVSDAGTPLVSDPGQSLVAAARDAGIRVEAVPGPSAVLAALSSSGLPIAEFTFMGFPPSRPKDRKMWLATVAAEPRTVVFFEAPHRVRQTLGILTEIVGPDRPIGVARELTKVHEELVVRPIGAFLEGLGEPRGEFTILLPASQGLADDHRGAADPAHLARELGELTDNSGLKRRQALKILAERHGIAVNELYRLLGEPD